MASISQKFLDLMNQKREDSIAYYNNALMEEYPILKVDSSMETRDKFEHRFAGKHLDLKEDFYDLECQLRLFQFIVEKRDFAPFVDLLIAFENLHWVEKLAKEFHLEPEESRSILKMILKRMIPFYIEDNVQFYNLSIATKKQQKSYLFESAAATLDKFLSLTRDPQMAIVTPDYLEKRKICETLRDISNREGMDSIFSYPSLLQNFQLSEEYLKTLAVSKKEEKQMDVEAYKNNMNVSYEDREKEMFEAKKQLQAFIDGDTINGVIENEKFQLFLELAQKVYSPAKVNLLKEKVLCHNQKLKLEKRKLIEQKVMNEEDTAYYDSLCSLDLALPDYLPYASYIQSTISSIEGFLDDLMECDEEELFLLYSEEIHFMLMNMKPCISFAKAL